MKVKFYVIREDASMFQCFITNSLVTDEKYLLGNKSSRTLPPNSQTVEVTGIAFHSFLNELNCCENFHKNAANNIKNLEKPFVIQIVGSKKEYIDYTWGEIVRTLIWEDLELDYMFSWFSTLGGAFSALGDYKGSAADTAGKISLHQMRIAVRLGNPAILARCKLYLSISLIQKEHFKLAKYIIKDQHRIAIETDDTRLRRMCLGIWSKLQWEYKVAMQKKHKLVL
ncbi:unnamed protein product [Diamesa hyperborea]